LWYQPLNQFQKRPVVAANFPVLVDKRSRHSATAAAAVTALTPDLVVQHLALRDHVLLACERIELLDCGVRISRRRILRWSRRWLRVGLLALGFLILTASSRSGRLVCCHQRHAVLFEDGVNVGLPAID